MYGSGRLTDKQRTIELLNRYSAALAQSGDHDAGAEMVAEMARVVGEIRE